MLVALFLNAANQRLPLPLFCSSQQMAVHAVRIRIAHILFGDAIHSGALGYAVDQLSPRPHCVFLDCVLIHGCLQCALSSAKYHFSYFACNFFNSFLTCVTSNFICKRRAVIDYFLLGYVVPYGQKDLLP